MKKVIPVKRQESLFSIIEEVPLPPLFVQEIQNLFYILENRIEFVVKYKRKILA